MRVSLLLFSAILGGSIAAQYISDGENILALFCLLLMGLTLFAKDDINSQYLSLSFLLVLSLDRVVFSGLQAYVFPEQNGFVNGNFVFGAQLLSSLGLVYLVKNKMRLSLLLTRGKKPELIEKNYAEGPLYGLALSYVFINMLALLENLLRNLEHVGVPEEIAKEFWEVTFLYTNFAFIKSILLALTIAVLYMGVIIRKRQSLSAA